MTGLDPLIALWGRAWLALRDWGLDQSKADADYVLRRALARAERRR